MSDRDEDAEEPRPYMPSLLGAYDVPEYAPPYEPSAPILPPQAIIITDQTRSYESEDRTLITTNRLVNGFGVSTTQRESMIREVREHQISEEERERYRYAFPNLMNGVGTGGVWIDGERDILIFNSLTTIGAFHNSYCLLLPVMQADFDKLVQANRGVKTIGIRATADDKDNIGEERVYSIEQLATFTDLDMLYLEWIPTMDYDPEDFSQFMEAWSEEENERQVELAEYQEIIERKMGESGHKFDMPRIEHISDHDMDKFLERQLDEGINREMPTTTEGQYYTFEGLRNLLLKTRQELEEAILEKRYYLDFAQEAKARAIAAVQPLADRNNATLEENERLFQRNRGLAEAMETLQVEKDEALQEVEKWRAMATGSGVQSNTSIADQAKRLEEYESTIEEMKKSRDALVDQLRETLQDQAEHLERDIDDLKEILNEAIAIGAGKVQAMEEPH